MQCAGQNVILMLTIGRSEQLRCIVLLMLIRVVVPGESPQPRTQAAPDRLL
jgi:hypothetical protein